MPGKTTPSNEPEAWKSTDEALVTVVFPNRLSQGQLTPVSAVYLMKKCRFCTLVWASADFMVNSAYEGFFENLTLPGISSLFRVTLEVGQEI